MLAFRRPSSHPLLAGPLRIACGIRLSNGILIVEIPRGFAQQEEIFMIGRWPVLDTRRHTIRLGPNDVTTEYPAISLKREGETPGHAAQVFGFQPEVGDAKDC